jgi:hypothetical protein
MLILSFSRRFRCTKLCIRISTNCKKCIYIIRSRTRNTIFYSWFSLLLTEHNSRVFVCLKICINVIWTGTWLKFIIIYIRWRSFNYSRLLMNDSRRSSVQICLRIRNIILSWSHKSSLWFISIYISCFSMN